MSRLEDADAETLRAMREDRMAFRLCLVLTFPLFLLAAAASRFLPARPAFAAGPDRRRKAIFAEARALAYTALPFAFMGW